MKINKICCNCSESHSFVVNGDDYRRWQRGEVALVQDAMPYLSEREILLITSGICERCQAIQSQGHVDYLFDV